MSGVNRLILSDAVIKNQSQKELAKRVTGNATKEAISIKKIPRKNGK
jgi:hypothetical protein